MAKISTDISQKTDLECRKSDNLYLQLTLEEGSVGSGDYFDLSSFTECTLVAKNQNNNSVLELYKSSGTNAGVKYYQTITVGSNGIILIQASSNAMTIPEGTYSYTLKVSSSTQQHTIMHGKLKIVD